jgi:hypothetical protein
MKRNFLPELLEIYEVWLIFCFYFL